MFELDDFKIELIYNGKQYTCEIYYIDSDNYAIRLYKGYNTLSENELFSTYIDSSGGEVVGNAEIYTMDNISELVYKCYDIYNFYVQNNMLTTGDREEYDNDN